MLWTIFIVLGIIVFLLIILGYGRGRWYGGP
jgi:hypothetical protein